MNKAPMPNLSSYEMATHDGICDFFAEQKRLPTYRELATRLGYASPSTVFVLAQQLVEKGWANIEGEGRSRRVVPIDVNKLIRDGFYDGQDKR